MANKSCKGICKGIIATKLIRNTQENVPSERFSDQIFFYVTVSSWLMAKTLNKVSNMKIWKEIHFLYNPMHNVFSSIAKGH